MSSLTKAKARKLLDEYGITSPAELDLYKIGYGETISIEEANLSGYLGRIHYGNGYAIIKIHKGIKEEGQKRFVIAHEMGHFFNETNNLKNCSELELLTYHSKQEAEYNANIFASELLLPEKWLEDFARLKKPGLELLQDTADYFNVSISAAALRIAQSDVYPVAVIMSTNGKVKWSSINKYFPFRWVPVGYNVNPNSYAYDIFKAMNEGKIINAEKANEVLADSWFLEDYNYKKDYFLIEQNIPMPNYNSVLTILWEFEG